ncbi:MAG: acylphosphatase [Anaerolineae bacterium]
MNEKTEQRAVHLIVHGRVQGVGFRYFTQRNAHRLGIVGWVKNRYDGTVEIQAEGTQAALQELIRQVQQGPSHAHVTNVEVAWQAPTGQYSHFGVTY